jgi:hypothetical protein
VRLAPKAELQPHKAAFREIFGETLSDEFIDEMLTHLESTLAPGSWDHLEPGTLNAAIAIIASVKPQTELEALPPWCSDRYHGIRRSQISAGWPVRRLPGGPSGL